VKPDTECEDCHPQSSNKGALDLIQSSAGDERAMPEFKFPLGGDVTQFFKAIWEPWTNFMGQLGFININIGATSAPEV